MADDKSTRQWGSVDDILDFAIEKEQEAVVFYTEMAEKTERSSTRLLFKDFACEEEGHKAKLQHIKSSKRMEPMAAKVVDLKIGDYLVDVEPSSDLDYQQALTLAMKREKAAIDLYTDLAAATDDENLRSIMLTFAGEEAKHKLRFETEYDEYVLNED